MSSEEIEDNGGQKKEILEDIRDTVEQDENVVEAMVNPTESKKSVKLKRTFGLLGCIALTVGSVVGSGIFGTPNYGAKKVESLATSVLLFAVFGVISTIGAICYVEVGLAFPLSGGDYSYMLLFFGPLGGCIYQWAANFILTPCDLAILSTVVAIYAVDALGIEKERKDMETAALQGAYWSSACICFGVAALCIITAVACFSTKVGAYVAKLLLGCKFVTATLIFSVAIYYASSGHKFAGRQNITRFYVEPDKFNYTLYPKGPRALDRFFSLSEGIYATAFSYTGWTSISFVVEEVKNPHKTLPLAALISLPIITMLYILLNFCYMSVLPANTYKDTRRVASEMMKVAFPATKEVYWIIPTLVAFCALGVLVCIVIVYARIALVGARNRHFPKFFSLLHVDRFTPVPSLIFLSCISAIYIALGIEYLDTLVGAATYLRLIFNGIVIAGNVFWRFKRPDYPRPFKAFIGLHILFVVIILFLGLIPFITADYTFKKPFNEGWKNNVYLIAAPLVLVILGIPTYFLMIKMKWSGNCFQRWLIKTENRIGIFLQKLFVCVPEEKDDEVEIEKYKLF